MITRYEAKCKYYIQWWAAFNFQPSTKTVIRQNCPNAVIVCVYVKPSSCIHIYYITDIMSSLLMPSFPLIYTTWHTQSCNRCTTITPPTLSKGPIRRSSQTRRVASQICRVKVLAKGVPITRWPQCLIDFFIRRMSLC